MTDSALERWRNRYGVPSATPVFIADIYGEQLARKLQARYDALMAAYARGGFEAHPCCAAATL